MQFESLESRRVLSAATPVDPLVLASLVGPDLVISSSSPEVNVSVIEDSGTLRVIGNVQSYYGTDGNLDQLQTDINNSGNYESDFAPSSLRDIKIMLGGVDSWLQVGDPSDPVTVGRDLIISMPAATTAAQLAYASVAKTTHLNLDVDSVTVGRNLTIMTGVAAAPRVVTVGESAVIDVSQTEVGAATSFNASGKGNLSITTNGLAENYEYMIGLAADTVIGNVSVTNIGSVDTLLAVVGTTVSGRLTIGIGAENYAVLCTDDFNETIDSNLQTFVTIDSVFGDGFDGELTDTCVQTLADDLDSASSSGFSFDAQSADISVSGFFGSMIDVHDATVSGGNLLIDARRGSGVTAVTMTTVDSSSPGNSAGNCSILVGAGQLDHPSWLGRFRRLDRQHRRRRRRDSGRSQRRHGC